MKRRLAAVAVLGTVIALLAPATAAQAAPALTPSLGGYVNAGVTAPFSVDLTDVSWSSAIVRIELASGTMSVDTTGLALDLQGSATFSNVTEIAFSGPLADVTTALADRLTWTAPATPADSYLRLTISVDSWVDGLTVNPTNGHLYMRVPATASWEASRDAAAALVHDGQQGYLATITSADENNFVATLGGGGTAYIAATTEIAYVNPLRAPAAQYTSNAQIAGNPHWGAGPEAGLPATYVPWFPGEPNGTATDRCMLTNWFLTNAGLWNDGGCGDAYPSIIEFGGITASVAALSFDNLNDAGPARAPIAAPQLAATGTDPAPLAGAGALVLALGAVLIARRRIRAI
jgi:LPXTG-motif cell wall-anchored protein